MGVRVWLPCGLSSSVRGSLKGITGVAPRGPKQHCRKLKPRSLPAVQESARTQGQGTGHLPPASHSTVASAEKRDAQPFRTTTWGRSGEHR